MRAAVIAVSAMMCITACDKREAAAENAREATEEARKKTEEAARAQEKAAEARQDARKTGADVTTNGDRRIDKDGRLLDENGKVINGETPPMRKIREEVRQTARDVGKAVDADYGKTEADKQVTERVREALKADKNLADDAGDIHIRTVNGEVSLAGTVATSEIAKAIGKAAARVAGATKVDNDLKVAERVGAGKSKD